MKKSEKIFFVDNLAATIKDANSLVFIDITGLKVGQQEKLRQMLRGAGAKLMVAKNTLLARALLTSNLKSYFLNLSPEGQAPLKSSLTGQTAVVVAEGDELASLQALGKFIREFELPKLKSGIISGNVYDSSALLTLSRLPDREVLYSQVVGTLYGPLYGIVGTLEWKMRELIYILQTSNVK